MLPLSRPGNLSTLLFSAFWEQVDLSTTAQYLHVYYLPSNCQVHFAGLLHCGVHVTGHTQSVGQLVGPTQAYLN